jgi:thioredoxin reductase
MRSTPALRDIIIIGGGPAGSACAIWAHQLGLRVLLVEHSSKIGGLQLRSPYVNEWMPGSQGRTGQDIAASLHAHLDAVGVPYRLGIKVNELRLDEHRACWSVCTDQIALSSSFVVVATGSQPRRSGFLESENVGIGPGMSMERIEVKGKSVAILGGGDNAFDQAIFAMKRGARSVDVFCRRPPHGLPKLRTKIDRACVHVGPFHADQPSMTVNGIPFDVFGVQFGFEARVPGRFDLPLEQGYVAVNRFGRVPGLRGVFAAGEVTNYWHPCVTTAYAHGVQVAKTITHEVVGARKVITCTADDADDRSMLSSYGPELSRPTEHTAPPKGVCSNDSY